MHFLRNPTSDSADRSRRWAAGFSFGPAADAHAPPRGLRPHRTNPEPRLARRQSSTAEHPAQLPGQRNWENPVPRERAKPAARESRARPGKTYAYNLPFDYRREPIV